MANVASQIQLTKHTATKEILSNTHCKHTHSHSCKKDELNPPLPTQVHHYMYTYRKRQTIRLAWILVKDQGLKVHHKIKERQ